MKPSRKFSRDFLVSELELPDMAIEDEVVDTTRWTLIREIVFQLPETGQFFLTQYSVGATESQYTKPWDEMDEVDCFEVVEKEVITKNWVRV